MRETKSSGAAIVLSFLWTGLGQLYGGRIGRGLAMMVATPVVWAMGWFGGLSALAGGIAGEAGVGVMGMFVAIAPFAWWIWGMADAKKVCEAANRAA